VRYGENMRPTLYIGNRNYSSWSMRPWLVLTWSRLEFDTELLPLGGEGYGERAMPSILSISPAGTVPALRIGDDTIADSLAISEWAAENSSARLWPVDPIARAHARAAACEMHSGFAAMRHQLPCNLRRRRGPGELSTEVRRDLRRIESIWTTLRARFGTGGDYLFGPKPTIADAFFTPVATRLRTYGVTLGAEAASYAATLLREPAYQSWEAEALRETWMMEQWDNV
jgi:glutathione S-transferase